MVNCVDVGAIKKTSIIHKPSHAAATATTA